VQDDWREDLAQQYQLRIFGQQLQCPWLLIPSMNAQSRWIDIGGINICVRYNGFFYPLIFDVPYQSFLRAEKNAKADAAFLVEVFYRSPPFPADIKPLFHMNDSWTVYRDDNSYVFQIQVPAIMNARWSARYVPESGDSSIEYRSPDLESALPINPLTYPVDQLLLMYHLAPREGIIIHAAGGSLAGKGLVFAGISGAGKSSVSKLLQPNRNWQPFSDDRIIIRKTMDGFEAYGTPWPGESKIAFNGNAPLSSIIFLKKSNDNQITMLKNDGVIQRLLPTLSIPWFDPQTAAMQLETCSELIARIPMYELSFNLECPLTDLLPTHLS
jgi:hypothetical protein